MSPLLCSDCDCYRTFVSINLSFSTGITNVLLVTTSTNAKKRGVVPESEKSTTVPSHSDCADGAVNSSSGPGRKTSAIRNCTRSPSFVRHPLPATPTGESRLAQGSTPGAYFHVIRVSGRSNRDIPMFQMVSLRASIRGPILDLCESLPKMTVARAG